jgi:CRISPR-associated protein Csd2
MSSEILKNRYEFVMVFDVKDGNPNGDPDAGNLPRIDAETGMGLVTDVCLKRKVRNYVQIAKNCQKPFDIFVKEKAILNNLIDGAYTNLGIDLDEKPVDTKDGKERKSKGKGQGAEVEKARKEMCDTFFDIRAFGAVMSTGANAGQVRGPIQFTFGRSIEPIVALEHSITRMAVTTEADSEKQSGDNRTMGRKFTVPYGVYRAHGFVSANLAAQTGFNEDDLNLFWEAVVNMFEHDHSAARGEMNLRKLVIFKHDSALGNAPAHKLFDRVMIRRKNVEDAIPARSFDAYKVEINKEDFPEGVKIIEKV